MPYTEKENILALREGNAEAFTRVIEENRRRIFSLLWRMTFSADDAENHTQEAFTRLWEHRQKLDPQYPIYPWLRRVAVNLVLDERKNREQHLAFAENYRINENRRRHSEGNLLDKQESNETFSHVKDALNSLSEDFRTILWLRAGEEMSYNEIAETLGIERGTVMSRIFRAREALAAELKKTQEVRNT